MYYVGSTNNLGRRLFEHQNKLSNFTHKFSGIRRVYKEELDSREAAWQRGSKPSVVFVGIIEVAGFCARMSYTKKVVIFTLILLITGCAGMLAIFRFGKNCTCYGVEIGYRCLGVKTLCFGLAPDISYKEGRR